MAFKKQNKTSVPEEVTIQQLREKTAQQWIPIADIDNGIVYRKDNILVGLLRIQPENLELLSDNEQRRKIEPLANGINGENEGFQIFCIGRPVDLNNYLEWMQDKAKLEQDFTRKMVLKGYIQQASQMASSGETTERRFYLIITKPAANKAELELLTRLKDFQIKFTQADLTTHLCTEDEIMDVLSLFANPVQAAYERTELRYDFPPILEK